MGKQVHCSMGTKNIRIVIKILIITLIFLILIILIIIQDLSNGGLMSGLTGHSNQIPTISVSVQTEPPMTSSFGLANTAALLSNGGLQTQVFTSIFTLVGFQTDR